MRRSMKAIQIRSIGGPEVLEAADLPVPVPQAGEVRVRALAIGVGKPDVLLRTGVYRWMPPLPAVPGAEMSGRVEAVGAGVESIVPGQYVLVYSLGGRCYAEQACVPATAVTPLPDSIDPVDAVSIPNYQVAHALLTEAARGQRSHTVYINGAAGGIGCAVIQLCRRAGIRVIAGAGSKAKCAFASRVGASDTVDYGSGDPVAQVLELTGGAGVDLVLDHLVGPDFTAGLKMLAPFGMIVSFNMLRGWPDKDLFRELRANLERSPAVRCFTMHSYDRDPASRRRLMAETVGLFAAKEVSPPVYRRLPLAQARQAHEMLDAREVLGKLVLEP